LLHKSRKTLAGSVFSEIPNLDLGQCLISGSFTSVQGKKIKLSEKLIRIDCLPQYDKGECVGVILILRDFTEMRQIAEDLGHATEEKARLESFLDLLDEAVIITDAWGKITNVNQAISNAEERETNIIGKKLTDIFADQIDFPILSGNNVVNWKQGEDNYIAGVIVPIRILGRIIGYAIRFQKSDNCNLTDETTYDYIYPAVDVSQSAQYTLNDIIGQSKAMRNLKTMAKKIARTKSAIMIESESGTGKELFAHAIHNLGCRSTFPFIKLNCAGLPDTLLESELFGYREGAFTGARKGGYMGRFELAHKGTLFLDEVGEMPLAMQGKFLRVLEEQEIQRLGDEKTRKIDVRIICATNRDLWSLIKRKQFREDLYYRLNVVKLSIPPLRERREDIRPLVFSLIRKYSREFQKKVTGISPDAYSALINYDWPGNVRELNNIIEAAFNIVDGEIIELRHLPSMFALPPKVPYKALGPLESYLGECEKEAVALALKNTGGNKIQAAKLLGISRAALYRKLNSFADTPS
jgi:transcriptional regulator with PAS, ATPase and Fis domain